MKTVNRMPMESTATKLKRLYCQKSYTLGIFKLSIFVLGKEKFSIRLEISWGWSQ